MGQYLVSFSVPSGQQERRFEWYGIWDTAVFTATEYSLIWRMLDLLGFPGLALYLILGRNQPYR